MHIHGSKDKGCGWPAGVSDSGAGEGLKLRSGKRTGVSTGMKLRSGRRVGVSTGVKRLACGYRGHRRGCETRKVVPVRWDLHPALNQQADRELSSVATPQGRRDIAFLAEAYQRGEPVSVPGAKKALETTAEIVAKLQQEFAGDFSKNDRKKMEKLALWVEEVKSKGCPHDETEQVLFCVATVQEWIRVYSCPDRTLCSGISQVLDLPWNLLQKNAEKLMTTAHSVLFSSSYSVFGSRPAAACKWLHLCTYEPLDEMFIFKTMGLPAAVVGFLSDRKPELHDGFLMGPTAMPGHDLNHAAGILRGLLMALIPKDVCSGKMEFKAFAEMPDTEREVIYAQMKKFYASMDVFHQELDIAVKDESEEFRILLYILLFELTHEVCDFQVFTRTQEAGGLEIQIDSLLNSAGREYGALEKGKYRRANDPAYNNKLNDIYRNSALQARVGGFVVACLDRFAQCFESGEPLSLADIDPSTSGSPGVS